MLLNLLPKRVRLPRIKDFVCPHEGYEVFRLGQIDDVVGVSRQHVDRPDLLPAHFELDDLIRSDLPLLDQAVPGDHDEELPLAVVPVLAFGDTGF